MKLCDQILSFLYALNLDLAIPGVTVLNPFQDPGVRKLCDRFYRKYYSDQLTRTLILGINPGRFGGGITGIPFTDPVKLEDICGIPNNLKKKAELSADFIYQMILAFGGASKFYQHFYISSVPPLGFTENGKNLNYYDKAEVKKILLPFILQSLDAQLKFGLNRKTCLCLGEDKNFKFLSDINDRYRFFQKVIPLPHPRFIMQYQRKKIKEHISNYLSKFAAT